MRGSKPGFLAAAAVLALLAGELGARLVIEKAGPRASLCPWSDACWKIQALGSLARRPEAGVLPPPLVRDAQLGWRTSPELDARRDVLRLKSGAVELRGAPGWSFSQYRAALARELSRKPAKSVDFLWEGDVSAREALDWRDGPRGEPFAAERELRRRSRLLLSLRAAAAILSGPPDSRASAEAGLASLKALALEKGAGLSVSFVATPEEPLGGREEKLAAELCEKLGVPYAKRGTGTGARTVPAPARGRGVAANARG